MGETIICVWPSCPCTAKGQCETGRRAIARHLAPGDDLVAQATAALDDTTPAPWWHDNNEGYSINKVHARHANDRRCYEIVAEVVGDSAEAEANARFIAFTRQWVPEAAARLSALTAERDQWRKAYHDTHDLFAQLDEDAAHLRDRLARMEGALRTSEAALADIGDAEREPEDDLAWCERRAADALPWVRAALTDGGSNG